MRGSGLVLVASMTLALSTGALAEQRVATVKPQYLRPGDLADALGVRQHDGHDVLEWRVGADVHAVDVRRNDAANLFVITGESDDVGAAEAMVKAMDVAPRQIMIEAQIVEIDRDRLSDLGFDWSQISARIGAQGHYLIDYRKLTEEFQEGFKYTARRKSTDRQATAIADGTVFGFLRALERAGAARLRDAPRILTLNNRTANILDGQRVTYITRYSSFTNLFETDTLDAGLTLNVTPSLGESGYLTLDVRTELTSLTGNISGSPVKDGQIVENTVIVKDGQTVLLGGFQRSVDQKQRHVFPVLGNVVPFLFSSTTTTHSNRESFVALTARVVDLNAAVDQPTRDILEGARKR
jgi:type II secretory pathway component GspD/PulD (secretin)